MNESKLKVIDRMLRYYNQALENEWNYSKLRKNGLSGSILGMFSVNTNKNQFFHPALGKEFKLFHRKKYSAKDVFSERLAGGSETQTRDDVKHRIRVLTEFRKNYAFE